MQRLKILPLLSAHNLLAVNAPLTHNILSKNLLQQHLLPCKLCLQRIDLGFKGLNAAGEGLFQVLEVITCELRVGI